MEHWEKREESLWNCKSSLPPSRSPLSRFCPISKLLLLFSTNVMFTAFSETLLELKAVTEAAGIFYVLKISWSWVSLYFFISFNKVVQWSLNVIIYQSFIKNILICTGLKIHWTQIMEGFGLLGSKILCFISRCQKIWKTSRSFLTDWLNGSFELSSAVSFVGNNLI